MIEAKFLQGSILRHISVMTGTASIGLMALFAVDLLDLYFLSLLGQVELAAAVGYAGSILFFTTSICIGLAIAVGALVARALGAGEAEKAQRLVLHAGLFSLGVTLPLAGLIWVAIPNLLGLIGAKGEALALATLYLRIVVPSMPVLALAMASGGVLRGVGAAGLAMTSTLAGGLVNAVLDPILIFGFDLGVAGAAWASVAARFAVLVVGLYGVVYRAGMLGRFEAGTFGGDIRAIAAISGPAILTNVATPVGNAYVTASMAAFGDDAVAGLSIIGRVIPVAFGMVFALSGAVGPVIGQNFGAGRFDRVRRALLDALLLSTAVVLLAALALFLLQDPIAQAFNANPETAALWNFFASFIAVLWAFTGAQFIAHAAFNNLGRPLWSSLSNWGRATLGTVPLVWLGALWFGPEGVLLGQAVGGVIFGLGASVLAWRLSSGSFAAKAAPQPPPFRIPLSPLTLYRGWLGLGGRDKRRD